MQHNRIDDKILGIMESYLLKGNPALLDELYDFGRISGKLSKATILQMWSGVSLKGFATSELRALFEFLNSKFDERGRARP